jgi:metallo-beta-lactamase family protein
MALSVLGLYRAAIAGNDSGIRSDMLGSSPFDTSRIHECRTTQESMKLAELTYPSIIISASGMATGGRVLHHLARLLPDPANAVILTGFQADGTRGERLASGERAVKMFGHYIPVRAHVDVIQSFSVHADADEIVAWLRRAPREPQTCFLVHGNEPASRALQDRVIAELGWCVAVPRHMERVLLD